MLLHMCLQLHGLYNFAANYIEYDTDGFYDV